MILSGANVYLEDACVYPHGSVSLEGDRIQAVSPHEITQGDHLMIFPENYHIIPGFIDLHVHGLGGVDVMDGKVASLQTMSTLLAKEGTTSFLATTMTASRASMMNALQAVRDYYDEANVMGADLLGVHLEGPFIAERFAGAQSHEYLEVPDIDLFKTWQAMSGDLIKLVTLAPELSGANDFITALQSMNVVPAIGHSAATFEEVNRAIEKGCRHGTHVFNAMQGLHHRDPGTVTPLLLDHRVMVEIIADGVHVHPAIIDLVIRLKGSGRTMLVTDAMRAKCMGEGEFDLGGQRVFVKGNEARLHNGRLAGSVLSMSRAIANVLSQTQCGISDIVKMTSENAAKQLKIFDCIGSIAPNKRADIVVLNDRHELVLTICRGKIVYQHSPLEASCQ